MADIQLLPAQLGGFQKCALFGSSMLESAHSGTTIIIKQSRGFAYWAELATRGRVIFPRELNFAVGGTTSEDFLTSVQDNLAAVVAAGCTLAILSPGSNNDADNDVAVATTVARYETMLTLLQAAGIRVILIPPTPRGSSTYPSVRLSTARLALHMQFRDWCFAQRNRYGVRLLDLAEYLADPASTTFDIKDAYTTDGRHLNTAGYRLMGLELADIIPDWLSCGEQRIPRSNAEIYSVNLPTGYRNLNPMLQGTGGSKGSLTGSMPTNYKSGGSVGGSATRNLNPLPDGSGYQLDWTAQTFTDASPRQDIESDDVDMTGVAVGGKLYGVAEVEWTSGISNIVGISLSILRRTVSSGTGNIVGVNTTGSADIFPSEAGAGLFITDELEVLAGGMGAYLRLSVRPQPNVASAIELKLRSFGVVYVPPV